MEKFMLIFHGGNSSEASPDVMEANMGKWMAWIERLTSADKYAGGEPLLPGGKLVSGKDKKTTDGPYTEGKEVIGGYFVINAKDMDEAVTIAKECPDFDYGGSVQVRQIMKM